jgi:hypothetical protein
MVKLEISNKRLALELAGFAFYLYELYIFFHSPITGFIYDGSPEIFVLRMILLLVAFPVLYIFRFSYLFGWGDAFAWFLASLTAKEEDPVISPGEEITGFEISIIINILLGVLIFFRVINFAYNFFSY